MAKDAGVLADLNLQKVLLSLCALFLPAYVVLLSTGTRFVALHLGVDVTPSVFPDGPAVWRVSQHILHNSTHRHTVHHEVSPKAHPNDIWGLALADAPAGSGGVVPLYDQTGVDLTIELPKQVEHALQATLHKGLDVSLTLVNVADLLVLQSILLCAFAMCHVAFSGSNLISQDEDVHIDKLHGSLLAWDLLFWMHVAVCHAVAVILAVAPQTAFSATVKGLALFFPVWAACNMHVPSSGGKLNTIVCASIMLAAAVCIVTPLSNFAPVLATLALMALDFLMISVHTAEDTCNASTLGNFRTFLSVAFAVIVAILAFNVAAVYDKPLS